MRTLFLAAMATVASAAACLAEAAMIPVTQRNDIAYVSATDLENRAGIAIKKLPGSDTVVACSGARCARLKRVLPAEEPLWVDALELAKALGLAAHFTASRQQVRFEPEAMPASAESASVGLGDLAPNFRLPRLDGGSVALADFRGKRVLIQSWASW